MENGGQALQGGGLIQRRGFPWRTLTMLSPGKEYNVRICATDGNSMFLTSPWSNTLTFTTPSS